MAAFAVYAGQLRGQIPALVKDEANSDPGIQLAAGAASVVGSMLGSARNGLPSVVSAAVRSTQGLLRVARYAVLLMTGGVVARTLFVIGVALAGLAIGLAASSDLSASGSSGGGGSSFQGIALAVAAPILAVAFIGALRPPRRGRFASIEAAILAGGLAALIVAAALWLWGHPISVSSSLADHHRTVWLIIVILGASTLLAWVATAVERHPVLRMAGAAGVLLAVADVVARLLGYHPDTWLIGRATSACRSAVSHSCEATSAGHAFIAPSVTQLVVAAAIALGLAGLVRWASGLTD
jgi:hypothetical protein